MTRSRSRRPLKDRLLDKTHIDADGCWLWLGWRNNKGYGMLLGEGKSLILAHRASYQIRNGKIPNRLQVLHACDNPQCIRPDHLFLGDVHDNMKDMVTKGRSTRGEAQPNAKLRDKDVLAIRASTEKQKVISIQFGISQSAVSMIRNGTRWGHLSSSQEQIK